MKIKRTILLALALMLTALTACQVSAAETSTANNTADPATETAAASGGQSKFPGKSDTSRPLEKEESVFGRITAVDGNSITLELGTLTLPEREEQISPSAQPAQEESSTPPTQPNQGDEKPDVEGSFEATGETQTIPVTEETEYWYGNGRGRQGNGPADRMKSSDPSGQATDASSSGEATPKGEPPADIGAVPKGLSGQKPGVGQEQPSGQQKEASFEDITVDSMIEVVLNEDGTAKRVSIRSSIENE